MTLTGEENREEDAANELTLQIRNPQENPYSGEGVERVLEELNFHEAMRAEFRQH